MDAVPQRTTCERCGALLYEGVEIKSPFGIIEACSGRCAKCGRKLSSMPVRVDIKTVEQRA